MLLQFAVENFRSFREEALLNLVPAKSRIHPDHVLVSDQGRKVKALPIAVLYGANASGKSNLIRAVDFAQTLIVDGTHGEDSTGAQPFLMDPEWASKPSRFEFVFKFEDVLYTYGFVANSKEILEEWLFAVFQKQEVRLFERVTESGRARVELGSKAAGSANEKQRLRFVAEGTRPNQLFLTEASERNVAELAPPMRWFRHHLVVIWPEARFSNLIPLLKKDPEFASYLNLFLKAADTGIQGIKLFEVKDLEGLAALPPRVLASLPTSLRESILSGTPGRDIESGTYSDSENVAEFEDGQEPRWVSIKAQHRDSAGEEIQLPIQDESDGTRRLLHLAPALFLARSRQVVYLVDELDRSLHPHLCRLFVESFLQGTMQQDHGCQIVLTTHETSILDLELLRRDEIYFLERNAEGASSLSSLVEFKENVRADLNVAKSYLNGRFGGIPLVRRTALGL